MVIIDDGLPAMVSLSSAIKYPPVEPPAVIDNNKLDWQTTNRDNPDITS